MLWRTRFFIMLVQAYTKSLRKQGIQNICLQEFPILLALNFYAFMCTYDFYRYEHVYSYRISQNFGKQEIKLKLLS